MKKYGYMIKTVDEMRINGRWRLVGFNNFIYPRKKGARVVAKDWKIDTNCQGGIFGIIHETRLHHIHNRPWWIILRYELGTEVEICGAKIKVPYAWMVDWDISAEKIQRRFEELTGRPYTYDYAVQNAEQFTEQFAERWSVQVAGFNSSQKGLNYAIQAAGKGSEQSASFRAIQAAATNSSQVATDKATQIAGVKCRQTAGAGSLQTACGGSYQSAGDGSVSIIHGKMCYCRHRGRVLQILIYNHEFYSTIIDDGKLHRLEIIYGRLVDTILVGTTLKDAVIYDDWAVFYHGEIKNR